MKLIGHRASCGYFIENSIQAIEYSNKIDIDGIEIDIQFTSDNYPVISHDRTLERLFKKEIFIHDISKEDLNSFSDIISLEDVLKKIRPELQLFIEIKGGFNLKGCEKILDILDKFSCENFSGIDKFNWYKNISISSFNENTCQFFWDMKIYLSLDTEFLYDRIINYNVIFITANTFNINTLGGNFNNCNGFIVHHENLDNEIVEFCKKYKKFIYVYTVNSRLLFNYVKTFNVDGVISDVPLELR